MALPTGPKRGHSISRCAGDPADVRLNQNEGVEVMPEDTPKADSATTGQPNPPTVPPKAQPDPEPGQGQTATTALPNAFDLASRFSSSGLFFMIIGGIFLWISFETMGKTHTAMSFVFVVVGVAILLYGTGTQGMGQFDSGKNAEKVARYKVALAGGAGVIAFCVAGGIIAYSERIRSAFQVEQKYLRLHIKGKSQNPDDIGRYLPDVRINGNPVPAVRRGDYIEVYAPYRLFAESARFEVRARLRLVDPAGSLRERAEDAYTIILKVNGNIEDDGKPVGTYSIEAGSDFPRYTLQRHIDLRDDDLVRVGGVAPQ
jgi:hypothetical protein